MPSTEELNTRIRIFIYDRLLARGLPPKCADIGSQFGWPDSEARERLGAISIGKTILTHPVTGEIWMAGPFAAAETQYRVIGAKTTWWANCAWDMFGVAGITGEDVRIETSCTDCGDPWTLSASPVEPTMDDGLVHFLLPAREWYKDIGFT